MPVKRAKPASTKKPKTPRAAKAAKIDASPKSPKVSLPTAPKGAKTRRGATSDSSPKPAAKSPGKANHHRRLFALDVYESNKNAIKAPFKALEMKWQYLGPGKGRYAKEGAQAFVQFKDEGADYSIWGPDAAAIRTILDAWKPFEGRAAEAAAAATQAESEAAESEAMRLWKLGKPVQRPGEPDGFYRRRIAEWEAQRPS